jgi:hypothetical protein
MGIELMVEPINHLLMEYKIQPIPEWKQSQTDSGISLIQIVRLRNLPEAETDSIGLLLSESGVHRLRDHVQMNVYSGTHYYGASKLRKHSNVLNFVSFWYRGVPRDSIIRVELALRP